MSPTLGRPFKRLLVVNRGEIATRIINAAREHQPSLTVFAVATKSDTSHALSLPPSQVLELPAAGDYLNIPLLIELIQENDIDAVHPGYGFLSESADFAQRVLNETKAFAIGPGPEILAQTGDKLAARRLAEECRVPVLPAMVEPTGRVEDARSFVDSVGLPVMIKAVDGGGGRGIRLVRAADELESSVKRAVAESPSNQVFVEKAAVDGFRHIEVQIIGDGTGAVSHLWERECSIQRRYQKIVELAPSIARQVKGGDSFVTKIIEAAVRMAKHVKYLSLGTFEFLANPHTQEFFFLEINPRLQVEHTITEQISLVDIVNLQLSLAGGRDLTNVDSSLVRVHSWQPVEQTAVKPPPLHSIQFRLTAENPQQSFSLSIGKISGFSLPSGNGVRVDTNLVSGHDCSVTADFDSLLAKVIVTGSSWSEVTRKARRALQDTRIDGVKTNLDVLLAIVASKDFANGSCDTQWLETNVTQLIAEGAALSETLSQRPFVQAAGHSAATSLSGMSSSTVLLRKGDAWKLQLDKTSEHGVAERSEEHLLKLSKVLRNEFPALLSADVEYSVPGKNAISCRLTARATSAGASGLSDSAARRGNASDPSHVIVPFSGKLVEILVDQGDQVQPGQVICVIKQMKMELEVRARDQQRGQVTWVTDIEDGSELSEGMLIAELDTNSETQVAAKL